jgi:hypothetical protein
MNGDEDVEEKATDIIHIKHAKRPSISQRRHRHYRADGRKRKNRIPREKKNLRVHRAAATTHADIASTVTTSVAPNVFISVHGYTPKHNTRIRHKSSSNVDIKHVKGRSHHDWNVKSIDVVGRSWYFKYDVSCGFGFYVR